MGSEMCIRDSLGALQLLELTEQQLRSRVDPGAVERRAVSRDGDVCLLYTSDAADERSSVDLGGRRIIKKKKMRNSIQTSTE